MATTLNLELRKRATSKGLFPIFIRITKDRKSKRIQTSVAIARISDWNPKGAKNQNWIRASVREAPELNDILAKELEDAKKVYRENKGESPELLKNKMQNSGSSDSFVQYALDYRSFLLSTASTSAPIYGTFCFRLQSWLDARKRKDLLFSEITPAVVNDFHSYLLKEGKKMSKEESRLGTNSVRSLLVRFRKLMNKAISEGLIPAQQYPFGKGKFQMPKEVASDKEALTEEEIAAIRLLDYPAFSALWNARNAFLFSFYCAGIRIGDFVRLRWKNIEDGGNKLVYQMSKNKKFRTFQLMPQAKEILNQYRKEGSKPSDFIFPYLNSSADFARMDNPDTLPAELKKMLFKQIASKNALINKLLKQIAKDAGIEKRLTFHISRHTFASIALEKNVSSKVVQEALAHSSLSTTERYLHDFKNSEVDSALKQVFDYEPDEKAIQRINQEGTEALLEALLKLDKESISKLFERALERK